MELREISVEDVYPDENNPRKDFGDIAALAESCMLNAVNPGEPVNPIVVVEDGGIYRIVDGERRYKAMRRNKLARCHAVVCDDMDEANAMVAMVATDDKRRLTDVERSRGVQQMLLLGVDPERVERVGRMPKGSAARISRARAVVDDAGDDMTLERMLAIAEFEADGDYEAVDMLAECSESEWRDVAHSISAKRARAEKVSAILTACAGAGIALELEPPRYDDGYSYRDCESDPEEIAARLGELPEGTVAWLCEENYPEPEVRFYSPRGAESAGPEAEARAELVREVASLIEAGSERRARWFARTINVPGACPNVKNALLGSLFAEPDGFHGRIPKDDLDRFAELAGDGFDAPDMALSGAVAAYLYVAKGGELHSTYSRELVAGCNNGYVMLRLRAWMEWMAAFAADGYAYDEGDARLMSMAEQAIESCDEEEEE